MFGHANTHFKTGNIIRKNLLFSSFGYRDAHTVKHIILNTAVQYTITSPDNMLQYICILHEN